MDQGNVSGAVEGGGGDSAPVSTEVSAPAAAAEKKYKLNVYGSEVELSESDLVREAQKGFAADKKWKEASELHNKAKPVLDKLQAGDLSFILESLPKDKIRAFAEDYLLEQLEWDSLTPDQQEHRELKRFKEETDRQRLSERERAEQDAKAQAVNHWAEKLDTEIADAITSSGRKVTPRTVKRMAENMLALLEKQAPGEEFRPVSAKDAFGSAIKELETDVTDYIGGLSLEQLTNILPKGFLDELRKQDVDRAMKQNPTYTKRQAAESIPTTKKTSKITSTDDYIKTLINKFGG